jgi:hypothetical protein
MLHGWEKVTPLGKGGDGGAVTINMSGVFLANEAETERWVTHALDNYYIKNGHR